MRELGNLKVALFLLSQALPEGTTLRRGAALIAVAHRHAMGHDVTLSEIVEDAGTDREGKPVFGTAPDRVLDNFRSPSKSYPRAVNWITTEEDPDDRRRKYLHLSPEGEKVMSYVAQAVKGTA